MPPDQRDKRILVLGSAPHTRSVSAYTWDDLPYDLNVADYDVVILNYLSYSDDESSDEYELPDGRQLLRLLFSQGSEIFALGVPKLLFFGWLPAHPKINSLESGEVIDETEPEFEYYFRHVTAWEFYLMHEFDRGYWAEDNREIIHPYTDHFVWESNALAQTRFHRPIAFELWFMAVGVTERYRYHSNLAEALEANDAKILAESGRFIWLPPPTQITGYEAIDLILQKQYGLLFEQTAPVWVKNFKLPYQIPIEDEVDGLEQEIDRLQDELVATKQRLQEETRFRKLLYEYGQETLEPIVREALEELGADVEEPKHAGREDGRLVDLKGRNGILEIKGRTGSLSLSDVRQLHDWADDAFQTEDWDGKGILIANTYRDSPPTDRGEAFPSNCVRTAERWELCLMTTTQVFQALIEYQQGSLDVEEFWDTVMETDGICPLAELDSPEADSA